jgi:hypothetical protein
MDENAITLVVVVLVCLLPLVDTKYITWKQSHLSSCRPEDFSKIWPEMWFVITLGISCLFHVKISIILFYVEKKWHMVYTVEPNEYFHSALVDSTKGFSKYNYSLRENYLAKLVFFRVECWVQSSILFHINMLWNWVLPIWFWEVFKEH